MDDVGVVGFVVAVDIVATKVVWVVVATSMVTTVRIWIDFRCQPIILAVDQHFNHRHITVVLPPHSPVLIGGVVASTAGSESRFRNVVVVVVVVTVIDVVFWF